MLVQFSILFRAVVIFISVFTATESRASFFDPNLWTDPEASSDVEEDTRLYPLCTRGLSDEAGSEVRPNTDVARRYSENQSKWNEYSRDRIDEVASQIRELINESRHYTIKNIFFLNFYNPMAKKRQAIEKELRPIPGWERFGEYRKDQLNIEIVQLPTDLGTPQDQPWRDIAPTIKSRTTGLPRLTENKSSYGAEYRSKYLLGPQGHGSPHQNLVAIRKGPSADSFFSKYFLKGTDTSTWPVVEFIYPFSEEGFGAVHTSGDFIVGHDLFIDALLAEDPIDFMIKASRMMHFMAQVLPVKRGNASIMDWIMRGMAKAKGVDLGPWKSGGDVLGWDFEAFLTPDLPSYAKWFQRSAFSKPNFQNFCRLF